jgi:GrpB-like predicted nucleotidyltransferase (UPF0157 family)
MLKPFAVDLQLHDPAWAFRAREEARRLAEALGATLIVVHHIGSTAIPGIRAKPILDLMPIVSDLAALERQRPIMEKLGYAWHGTYGLPDRRYCTLDDPRTGRRKIQAHCYPQASPEIPRHLAFRDYLRANPEIARAYEAEKCRCRDLHPGDHQAYGACKSTWITRIEAVALAASSA